VPFAADGFRFSRARGSARSRGDRRRLVPDRRQRQRGAGADRERDPGRPEAPAARRGALARLDGPPGSGRRGIRRAGPRHRAAGTPPLDRQAGEVLERGGPRQPSGDADGADRGGAGHGAGLMEQTREAPGADPARELDGQVAFVTGGATGIVRAIADALAARGAAIGIFARDEQRAGRAANELRERGGKAESFAADVARAESVEAAFGAA